MKRRIISIFFASIIVVLSFCFPFVGAFAAGFGLEILAGWLAEKVLDASLTSLSEDFTTIISGQQGDWADDISYLISAVSMQLEYCDLCEVYYDMGSGIAYYQQPEVGDTVLEIIDGVDFRCVDHAELHASSEKINYLLQHGETIRSDGGGGGGQRRWVLPSVPAETFSSIIDRLQNQYAPSELTEYVSMQTSKNLPLESTDYTCNKFPFMIDKEIWGYSISDDVYMNYYYVDSTAALWVHEYQLHFYTGVVDGVAYFYCDTIYIDCLTGETEVKNTYTAQLSNALSYSTIFFGGKVASISQYTDANKYLSLSTVGATALFSDSFSTSDIFRSAASVADALSFNINGMYVKDNISWGSMKYSERASFLPADWGFYISDKPIEFTGLYKHIDPEKIDPNGVITPTGGDINNWTITGGDGSTNTIGDYVQNNYTYNYYGDGGGNGGGTGGVSGDIDVSGKIEIVGGGQMPVEVDVTDYLEKTPEQAKPITEFIGIFFDFLPPDLLALICLGVTVAIILRIWGR